MTTTRIIPNFFIIGAPKCGTTSMAYWLSNHHEAYLSSIKEPHFFNTDMKNRNIRQIKEYRKLFNGVTSSHKAVGEGSTWYLYSKEAVPNILKFNPDAKFIIMLRNPVDMVQSLHEQHIWGHSETEKDFHEAWNLQESRKIGVKVPIMCPEPKILFYKDACALGSQLKRFLQIVPKEQYILIFLDDLKKSAQNEFDRVLDFLNLDKEHEVDLKPLNSAKEQRNQFFGLAIRLLSRLKYRLGIYRTFGVSKLNTKKRVRKSLNEDVRDTLVTQFKEDIENLSQITGRNLSGWLQKTD